MKPLCSRALFLSREHNPHFPSLFLRIYHFSTVSGTASYHNFPRRQEEDSRNVRVSVWWDFENCNIPAGVNEFKVAQTISAAVRANGMKGPIQITAFGDIWQLSKIKQEALSSTGIIMTHVPRGGKNSADRSLLVDLLYWTSQNPPPAHLFLISGDRDFAGILHRLKMVNYNILLASPEDAPAVLCSAASIMWQWSSLVKGEDLSGKLYNQPPDGPYGSWYGHYKRPLEDPFVVDQQKPPPLSEDEPCLKSKTCSIPEKVLRQVQQILRSHPKGISIGGLRVEFTRRHFPKDYYGYKVLSRFIQAMPHIVKLQKQGDGRYLVLPATVGKIEAGEVVVEDSDDLKVEVAELCESGDGIEKKTSSEKPIRNSKPKKVKISASIEQNGGKCPPSVDELPRLEKSDVRRSDTQVREVQDSTPEVGFFKRVWRRWFGFTNNNSNEKSREISLSSDRSKETINEQISHCPRNEIFSNDMFWRDMKSFLDSPRGSIVCLCATRADMARKLQKEGPAAVKTLSESDLLHLVDLLIDEKKLVEEDPSKAIPFKLPKPHSSKGMKAIFPDKHGSERNYCNIPYSGVSVKEKGSKRSKDQILENCKELVIEVVRKNPDGYNLGKFKKDFEEKYGYSLDVKILGYKKVSSLLQTLPGVVLDRSKETINEQISHCPRNEIFSNDMFWRDMKSFLDSPRGSIVCLCATRADMARKLQKEGPAAVKTLSESDLLHLVDLLIDEKKLVEEDPSKAIPFKLPKPYSSKGMKAIFPDKHGSERNYCNTPYSGVSVKEKGSKRSKDQILENCKELMIEVVRKNPDGYNLVKFKKDFKGKYGYSLDVNILGYQKVSSLLQTLPGVVLDSGFTTLLRSKCHVSTNSDSEASDISLKSDEEFESPWNNELGPLANSNPDGAEFESSRSEDELDMMENSGGRVAKQKEVSNKEDSALIDLLNSWYSEKELSSKKRSKNGDDKITEEASKDKLVKEILDNMKKTGNAKM